MSKTAILQLAQRDEAYPVIIISVAVISLILSWLAAYGAEELASHHVPLRAFLGSMIVLALRDLARMRRDRSKM